MPDFGPNDPLTAAIAGRGGLYNLSTATQPGQGALDNPNQFQIPADPISQIQGRRQQLLSQIPYTRGIRNLHAINSELGALDSSERQIHWEAGQRRLMAHQQAQQAAQMLKTDRETSIDEQGANLMLGLGRLDALHRNGQISPDEYDSRLLDLGQQNILGLRHPEAAKMYDHFITESDRRNNFDLRRNASEAARLAGRYGVDVQTDENGMPSIEATKAAALMSDKGKAEQIKQMNSEMFQKYGVATGVGSLFNPIAPHQSPDNGKTTDIPYVNPKGEVSKVNVPTPLFNQMKSDFNDRYFSIVPQQTQQTSQPAQSGLQVGTQRSVGGTNYSWNGQRWEPQ